VPAGQIAREINQEKAPTAIGEHDHDLVAGMELSQPAEEQGAFN
jgi:hypothetical protein